MSKKYRVIPDGEIYDVTWKRYKSGEIPCFEKGLHKILAVQGIKGEFDFLRIIFNEAFYSISENFKPKKKFWEITLKLKKLLSCFSEEMSKRYKFKGEDFYRHGELDSKLDSRYFSLYATLKTIEPTRVVSIARGGLYLSFLPFLLGFPVDIVEAHRKGRGSCQLSFDSVKEIDVGNILQRDTLLLLEDAISIDSNEKTYNLVRKYLREKFGINRMPVFIDSVDVPQHMRIISSVERSSKTSAPKEIKLPKVEGETDRFERLARDDTYFIIQGSPFIMYHEDVYKSSRILQRISEKENPVKEIDRLAYNFLEDIERVSSETLREKLEKIGVVR